MSNYTFLAQIAAISSGIAKAYTVYADPLLTSGLLNPNNVSFTPLWTNAGFRTFRSDDISSGTGWQKTKHAPTSFTMQNDRQIKVDYIEAHNKPVGSNEGVMLEKNMVDQMTACQASFLEGMSLIENKAQLSANAIYNQYLKNIIGGIFADHKLAIQGTPGEYDGTVVTFANDVTNAAYTLTTDLSTPGTNPEDLGYQLARELSSAALPLNGDGSGRIVYCLLPTKVFNAFRTEYNAAHGVTTNRTYGDTMRDGTLVSPYQVCFTYDGIVYVNCKDWLPTTGTGPTLATRGLLLTSDALKVSVVQAPLKDSITFKGQSIAEAMNVFYTPEGFASMLSEIPGSNAYLSSKQLGEQTRPSIMEGMMSGGMLDSGSIVGCIGMYLKQIGIGTGEVNAMNYVIFGQMWSAIARANNRQLRELIIPNALMPAGFNVSVAATKTTKNSQNKSQPMNPEYNQEQPITDAGV